jgi:multidrug efflux pump subunit AcrA (membrane-fusion protein)
MSALARAVIGTAVIALVAIAVIAGLFLIGPPGEERKRKLDAIRVSDLRAIAAAVDRYWTTHSALPASLEALAKERDTSVRLLDPETGQPYQYRVSEGDAYELCADFASYDGEDRSTTPGTAASGESYPGFWSHQAGWTCFRIEPRERQ